MIISGHKETKGAVENLVNWIVVGTVVKYFLSFLLDKGKPLEFCRAFYCISFHLPMIRTLQKEKIRLKVCWTLSPKADVD